MKTIYPKYFKEFNCIAGHCPDTCCAGWEVVIDQKFRGIYKASCTPAAKKAVERMYTDSDGDVCLRLNNGRCPMLNSQNLCEIYIDMGKDALCDVCRTYPRFFKEADGYTIAGLSLSCPEAARIILSDDSEKTINPIGFVQNKNHKTYFEIYNLLTQIVLDGNFFACNFEKLEYAADELTFDTENFSLDLISDCFGNTTPEYMPYFGKAVFEQLSESEFLTDDWSALWNDFKTHIVKCNENPEYLKNAKAAFADLTHMKEIKNTVIYLLYKYLWEAIDEQNTELWIKRAYGMARLICELCCLEIAKAKSLKQDRLLRLAQLTSKEIEHNEDNLYAFEEFCSMNI